jgi:hypothetical protein
MAAIDTFRRTMRRLEKRARANGHTGVGFVLRSIRLGDLSRISMLGDDLLEIAREMAESHREDVAGGVRDRSETAAFLYDRAADAVERYIAARAKESA